MFRAPSYTRRFNVRGGLVLVGVTWKGAVLTTYVPEDLHLDISQLKKSNVGYYRWVLIDSCSYGLLCENHILYAAKVWLFNAIF